MTLNSFLYCQFLGIIIIIFYTKNKFVRKEFVEPKTWEMFLSGEKKRRHSVPSLMEYPINQSLHFLSEYISIATPTSVTGNLQIWLIPALSWHLKWLSIL